MKPRLAVLLLALLSFAAPVGCSYDVVIDSDGDTVPDNADLCPDDPGLSENEGACGCNYRKINGRCVYIDVFSDITDSDGDGTPDPYDHCPIDPNKIEPGICGCGTPDTDTDGDTTPDCIDACPNDHNKTEPGFCGCGKDDLDENGDTIIDCADDCPDDPNKLDPGICGCGTPDTDSDGDSTPDCIDQCPDDPNKTEEGHCGCGVSDIYPDGTSKIDCDDECPYDPNKTKPGFCGCGIPDDANNDNLVDCFAICVSSTVEKELFGVCGCDTLDTDTDDDGTPDCIDKCPDDPNKIKEGSCGCGTLDTDTDDDGTPDCIDECPDDPNKIKPGICGCGTSETGDSDNDGVHDCNDKCPHDPNKIEPGICGCGISETGDSDNDGVHDCNDACPRDPTRQEKTICSCGSSGHDGEVGELGNPLTVCIEEGGVLQVGYTNTPFEANSYETMLAAFNNRSISHQNIRLHYAPARNLLTNPTLEYNDAGWTIRYFVRNYGTSYGEDCTYQAVSCLCRAFGKYPALVTDYSWRTTFKQQIQLSNTQCKDATACTLPLTVGMFAFAIKNNATYPNDKIKISFMNDTLEEDVGSTETKFFTMTKQVHLSETPQKIGVTFSGNDVGAWADNYGAALQYFGAWLGDREIRFSNDGTTWTPWTLWEPDPKGDSDAWFVEWDLGKCDADETSCTKTVYMQTHDILTDRYYETSDSVKYIPN